MPEQPPVEPTFRSDVTVQLVSHTASDAAVVFAARVSTQGERSLENLSTWDQSVTDIEHPQATRNRGLINYLMRERHGSPWEHTSMTFLISAPIFVFREFHRHRAGWSYNEESGRYRELKPVFYVPGPDRRLVQEGKPGHYQFTAGTKAQHELVERVSVNAYRQAYEAYQAMLAAGVAREVARSVLPVGLYSSMYASCNARSLMHFLGLRTTHPDAKVPSSPQREIEMVGEAMEAEWAKLMPLTYEAFNANGRVAP
ncbi:FAD-dependent thymidylate synthase [Streptomyces sp. DHE17-7]|uniref:FAD-dependent thymidylate synthase n=1 Tax=Streptomyces sp. DHE17-7 TaxID=2759949 RepID=UPI000EE00386|nr:FAD-dependent thymidylate synthase [Streptomyces sp. DHE17-7]MBJ6623579.1 FAD-dependent thymidylate synthase [Streptomyces sp. DHE17-7]RIH58367.1 FAD-dependent thymidylate synthase [Streptomyces sp. SHP22-7]RIH58667.1 FAD-dependent thymidylate synthase [Streptomyces sp. SHP22-7]